MSGSGEADALRAQMAGVRATMDEGVHDIVANAQALAEDARKLTDWRFYVKAAPWGTVGAAAALGYFLVPRRVEIVRPDADQLVQLAKRHQLVVDADPHPESKRSGAAQAVLTMVANAALRAATAYVSQQAGQVFGQQAAEDSEESRDPRPEARHS